MKRLIFSIVILTIPLMALGGPTNSWNSLLGTDIFPPDLDNIPSNLNSAQLQKILELICREIFNKYLLKYNKTDRNEEPRFCSALSKIAAHNMEYEAGNVTWSKGINQFTDMSPKEFSKYTSGNPPSNDISVTQFDPSMLRGQPPDSLDWRQQNVVSPVKDQGQCGSCWAFSAVAVLESFQMKNGKAANLSEQEMVDCDSNQKGCQGGWINKAFEYAKSKGVVSSQTYPYKAKQGSCQRGQKKAAGIIGAYSYVTGEDNLKSAVADSGLCSVGLNIGQEFASYKSGIYNGPCGDGGHFVTVVGYGNGYWILKNSWGEGWGMGGYMNLTRGCDKCGVSTRNGGYFITK